MTHDSDCQQTLREIQGFLDGEITDAHKAVIRDHLDNCPPCVGAYDFEELLRRIVAEKCVDPCPEQLKARIVAALAQIPAEADPATT